MNRSNEAEDAADKTPVLGGNTPVRIGVVAGLLTVVWWAAQLQSDVGTIKQSLTKLDTIQVMQANIAALGIRVDALERRGSEPMQQLQKSLDKLAEELRVHMATTVKGPP